jgi:hypothetical protein
VYGRLLLSLKEFRWDANSSTYGNLFNRIGEGDYLGGGTSASLGFRCRSSKKRCGPRAMGTAGCAVTHMGLPNYGTNNSRIVA